MMKFPLNLLACLSLLPLHAAFVVRKHESTCFKELKSNSSRDADSLDEPTLKSKGRSVQVSTKEPQTWQAKIENLLDPSTSLAQRQILLSDLLSANQEIRDSVSRAMTEGKIDSLLTPTGKRLQDGTRAVARQITNDIIPNVLESPPTLPDIELLPKIGSRVLNALSNQAKKTFDDFQGDLANPSRIPQRLSQQSQDFVQEAKNIFLETPEGLQGPVYSVVAEQEGYEIRDYEGYTVASTTMGKVGEPYSMDDVASSGAAFNSLAAYLFGGNSEGKMMSMTTPVTTTLGGEMRFYLKKDETMADFPAPLEQDDGAIFETGAVTLVDIPPARLAVRKFTGFVTEGEIVRQKDVLLQELELDGWEIDVDHGAIVPYIIFQYNPPYTIPVVRRNEIAVPIRTSDGSNLEEVWDISGDDDIAPSDVE
jgi:SOUL heme-binding protein